MNLTFLSVSEHEMQLEITVERILYDSSAAFTSEDNSRSCRKGHATNVSSAAKEIRFEVDYC